jgi:hypothetical protein
MTEKNFKYVQWLLYGLMGLSALLTILFYISPANPDMLLYWMYTLVILSIVVTLSSAVINILKNPKGSKKVVIIIVIMIVLAIISFAVSKNTLTPDQLERAKITAKGVKMVGAGLVMTYLIMIGAICVFIYTSVFRFFK